jgi:hypothetical protein
MSDYHLDRYMVRKSLIEGYTSWVYSYVCNSWRPYYINIMCHSLPGNDVGIVRRMNRAVQGFYGYFSCRFVHNQRSPAQQSKLPQLWLFLDRPCFKHEKKSLRDVTINNGLHYNGTLLIPPESRFRECPIRHIEENQQKYARKGIARIHVKPIDGRIPEIVDYSMKTIKWGQDDILILPRSVSELPGKSVPEIDPEARRVKDLQSAFNVSDEIAQEVLGKTVDHL